MSLVEIKSLWESKAMNLNVIKKSIVTKSTSYLTPPILIVGVQKIEATEVLNSDVNFFLQDPTGNYLLIL